MKNSKQRKAFLIYITAFVLAVCSILYEMLIAQTISRFMPNLVKWYSLTVGLYIGAMGIGAMVCHVQRNRRDAIDILYETEILLSIFGGASVLLINFLFILMHYFLMNGYPHGQFLQILFLCLCFCIVIAIGILTGKEIPLLIRISEENLSLKNTLNKIIGIDCLGSCMGGMLFPLFLLPFLGLLSSSFMIAIVNLLCVLVVLIVLDKKTPLFLMRAGGCLFFIFCLCYLNIHSHAIEQYFLNRKYAQKPPKSISQFFSSKTHFPEVERIRSLYQILDIVPGTPEDFGPAGPLLYGAYSKKSGEGKVYPQRFMLYINSEGQFHSDTEEFYHEYFAHVPIILQKIIPEEILVIGGGDGLLIRELLKYRDVKKIYHVDIDKNLVELCKTRKDVVFLNENALKDERVITEIQDGYNYVRNSKRKYDAIYIDLPFAQDYDLSKLYSVEFYQFVRRSLKEDGYIVFDIEPFSSLMRNQKMTERLRHRRAVYFNTLYAAGFRVILPYGIRLEEDNEEARKSLKEYYKNFIGKPSDKDSSSEEVVKEEDFWVERETIIFLDMQKEGYIMARKNIIDFDDAFVDLKIPLQVLNEERFKAAFSYFHFFDTKINPRKVNSIMRPSLLNI